MHVILCLFSDMSRSVGAFTNASLLLLLCVWILLSVGAARTTAATASPWPTHRLAAWRWPRNWTSSSWCTATVPPSGSTSPSRSELSPCPPPCFTVLSELSPCPPPCFTVQPELSPCPPPCFTVHSELSPCPPPCFTVQSELSCCPPPCFTVQSEFRSCVKVEVAVLGSPS